MTKEQIDFQDFTKIKILALTGKTAESYVRKNVPDNVTVKVLPVNIAAFITRNLIKKSITKKELQKYDLLLIPGLVQQDMTSLSEELGIPIIKGPRYASDIKLTLREISPFKLSSKYPADKYLKKIKQKELQTILTNGRTKPLEEHEFYIGTEYQLPVGLHRPPIIMAEIVDFTELSEEEIFSKADYFLRHGAEVLDLGAVAGNPKPDKIKEIIPDLRQKFSGEYNFLLSIDSLDSEEILVASQKNIDLVLSIDHSNIDAVIPRLAKDTGIVIVPTNVKEGTLPRTKEKRIQSLLELKKKLLAKGYEKLFADPILEMPINPGFSQSLNYYIHYRENDPHLPMMACVGNVTEFIAADPVGINALLNCIAVELGIQLLLVTDVSVKCRGGIKEVHKGRNLAYIAKTKNAPPKDHGIDLLLAKSRYGNDIPIATQLDIQAKHLQTNDPKKAYHKKVEFDPKGSFMIWLNYFEKLIHLVHLTSEDNKPDLYLTASHAKPLFEEILSRNLLSRLDHAYYLGRELERAEICLYLGKTYVQDEQVFQDK